MWENWNPIYREAYTTNQHSNTIWVVKVQLFGGAEAAEGKV